MIKIPLTQGKYAIIDDDMYDMVSYFKWFAHKKYKTFYAVSSLPRCNGKQKQIGMHQLIMGMPNSYIDHIDHDGLNNQKTNIRVSTSQENTRNRNKISNTSSKFKGVSWKKNNKKWMAYIMINGKQEYLGYYDHEHLAAFIYDLAAIKYFGEFAKLNF